MDNLTVILLVVTNILIVLILGLFAFFIYRLLKQQNQSKNTQSSEEAHQYHPAVLERFKEAEKLKKKRPALNCPNHADEPGETNCAICDRHFCRACIKPFKTLHYCKEHISLLMRHDWEEVMTVKTSTTDPEHGVRLYDRKKEVFERDELPTYVETHYKINVDQDYIETYLVLFGIKEQLSEVKQKFTDV